MINQKGIINYNLKLKNNARNNRKMPSLAESIVWQKILRNKQIGYKFLRQKPINNFILDFYCSQLLLGIEIDGDSHAEQLNYDIKRMKKLSQDRIKIIRYNNNDVIQSIESVYLDLIKQIEIREKELKLTPLIPLNRGR